MNALKIFEHARFGEVRITGENGEMWFVATDIAKALGYERPNDAINAHCKKVNKINYGVSGLNVINESDVYRLITRSHLPEAEAFQDWVFEEVLPSIRKHGGYLTPEKIEEVLLNPDTIIELATNLKEERQKRLALEAQATEHRPLVNFAKAVQASEDTILVKQLAGFMKQNGVDIGQNRLFEWLRSNGYLCRERGENWNRPTQKSLNLGLFEVKESISINPDGSTRLFFTSKVTGKGQLYFLRKFGVQEAV